MFRVGLRANGGPAGAGLTQRTAVPLRRRKV